MRALAPLKMVGGDWPRTLHGSSSRRSLLSGRPLAQGLNDR